MLQEGLTLQRRQDPVSVLACACAKAGDKAKAEECLKKLLDRSRGAYVQPYYVARAYAALGQ